MDELYADVGIGKRMPALVARHIFGLMDGAVDAVPTQDSSRRRRAQSGHDLRQRRRVGAAGALLPADPGRPDHRPAAPRPGPGGAHRRLLAGQAPAGKEPDRWIPVQWGNELNRRFDCRIRLLINNEKGILARVAAEIGESDANITYVGMDEDDEHMMTQLRFTIQVKDRVHLAHLIRNLRRVAGVNRVERERT
jgi:guanosine-3',5'-bis(diphosphate) 3'-pyrophosphohydrolase